MSELVAYLFEGRAIRVSTVESGEPWFVLSDVCQVLDISNPRDAASRLDPDERDGVGITDAIGRTQQTTVINESGLYSLIMTSRKAEAKQFKRWVTGEVLPAIRRTGGYIAAAPEETAEELALRAMTVLQATVARQKAQLAAAQPKADALDRLEGHEGSMCVTAAAKVLKIGPKELHDYLRRNGWTYRRPGGQAVLGYQDRITAGLLEHKVTALKRSDGPDKIVEQVLVTAKGLSRLAQLMESRRSRPKVQDSAQYSHTL